MAGHTLVEQPPTWMGPYGSDVAAEAFIDPPVGKRLMLSPRGPIDMTKPFDPLVDNYGGAIANCEIAFRNVIKAEAGGKIPDDIFPDYNLDGDRGYGWPCWNVQHPPGTGHAFDSLQPPRGGTVTVNPVPIR
jgi:hypothetical protein